MNDAERILNAIDTLFDEREEYLRSLSCAEVSARLDELTALRSQIITVIVENS